MSGPTFVVLPASSNTGEPPNQETAEIASTIQDALYKKSHPEPEQPGPFKQILAHSDSLYKYINWEDPMTTLGLYVGALSVLFGAHYLPLTQVALKAGATIFGVVSVTEFLSRSFSTNSVSTRLRPKEYKTIPESTLNATLKDIHDLIQYTVLQAQKIIFGQDLDKTFATFLGFTALYWATQIVPPFSLAVIGLTMIFVAPLALSPKGREVAHDASVRAQELAKSVGEKGEILAQNTKATASELSAKGKQTVVDLSARTKDTASDISGTAAEMSAKGKQTVVDLSARARDTTRDMSGTAADKISTNGSVNSNVGNINGHNSTSSSTRTNGNSEGDRTFSTGAADETPQSSNSASAITNPRASKVDAGNEHDSNYLHSTEWYLPAQTSDEKIGSVKDVGFEYTVAGR